MMIERDTTQYSLAKIMGLWLLVTVPMGPFIFLSVGFLKIFPFLSRQPMLWLSSWQHQRLQGLGMWLVLLFRGILLSKMNGVLVDRIG